MASQPILTFSVNGSQSYTETITRDVGPTTASIASGRRGTPAQPAPSDSNSIFLAPNGNDANAGTFALPKLTLSGAIAALTAGKPTVVVIRNGSSQKLTFNSNTNITLPASRNIQAYTGEIAYFTFGVDIKFIASGNLNINNCEFRFNYGVNTSPSGCFTINTAATSVIVNNIAIYNTKVETRANYVVPTIFSDSSGPNPIFLSANFSLFCAGRCFNAGGNLATNVNFTNCIFVAVPQTLWIGATLVEQDGNLTCGARFDISSSTLTTFNPSFTRCVFYGFQVAVYLNYSLLVGNTPNHTFSSCSFYSCNYAFGYNSTQVARFGKVTLDYTFVSGIFYYIYTGGVTPFVFTITTNITNDKSSLFPLYVDLVLGGSVKSGSAMGFKLQRIGLNVSNVVFFINSPFVGAGPSGVDIGPWNNSIDYGFFNWAETITFDRPPKAGERARILAHYAENVDIVGNIAKSFNAQRREYLFKWDGSEYFASNDTLWKLERLLADSGTLLMWRQGLNGNEYPNVVIGAHSAGETFTIVPSPVPLQLHKWAGWVMFITNDSLDAEVPFLIMNNTSTVFSIRELLLVDTIPPGGSRSISADVSPFRIPCLPVKSSGEESRGIAENYRGDRGQLERDFGPLTDPGDAEQSLQWQVAGQLKVTETRILRIGPAGPGDIVINLENNLTEDIY